MEQPPASPIALLNRGIAAYHAGDSDEALRLFAQALLIDPESELGWLWFAAVTDDPGEKRYALDRAVSINPDSIGVASRKRMLDTPPVMPNELTDIGALPLPPELAELELRPRFVPRLARPRLVRAACSGPRQLASAGSAGDGSCLVGLLVALAAAGALPGVVVATAGAVVPGRRRALERTGQPGRYRDGQCRRTGDRAG